MESLERRNMLATITVNSLLDNGDGANTTLREAITSSVSGDTIVFSVTGTIQLTTAGDNHLTIDNSLTIQGPGANLLTIRAFDPDAGGNNDSDGARVFSVNGSGTLNVTISGLTLTNGDPDEESDENVGVGGAIRNAENLTLNNCVLTGNFANHGGSIYNSGTLTINDCTISGNAAEDGAGIFNEDGIVTVNRSTFQNNAASNSGGGIFNRFGDLTIVDSTLSGNMADLDAEAGSGSGGAIASYESSSTINITSSTISGNGAQLYGGGLYQAFGTLTITNSTISGNSANDRGAGIFAQFMSNDALKVNHSTITANTTPGGGNSGAGIRSSARAILEHTIVAGNIFGASTDDLSGTFTLNFSLIGDGSGFTIATNNSSLLNANANLSPLADNGGGTKTHALLIGSQAIDAGNAALVAGGGTTPAFDQRGTPYSRVADGDGGGGDRIDIGAFEVPTPAPLIPEIAVTGNGEEITDGDMSPSTADGTDFGSTLQGGATVSRTFTVRNDGTGTLTLGAVSMPDGFTVTDPLVASLAAGAADTLIIQLDTTTAGTKTGDVSFTTNDSDETTFNFSITAIVIATPDLPGDYNLNSVVDAADYVFWRKMFGATVAQYVEPDGNGDTMIDDGDYAVWVENFGETLPPGAGGGQTAFAISFAESYVQLNDAPESTSAIEAVDVDTATMPLASAALPVSYGAEDFDVLSDSTNGVSIRRFVASTPIRPLAHVLLALDLARDAGADYSTDDAFAGAADDETDTSAYDEWFEILGEGRHEALL